MNEISAGNPANTAPRFLRRSGAANYIETTFGFSCSVPGFCRAALQKSDPVGQASGSRFVDKGERGDDRTPAIGRTNPEISRGRQDGEANQKSRRSRKQAGRARRGKVRLRPFRTVSETEPIL